MSKNTHYRKDKIPLWINLVNLVVIAISSFQVIAIFVTPSWAYGTFENIDANRQAILTKAEKNNLYLVL